MTQSSQRFAELRARRALAGAGLDADRRLVPIPSATNEVWDAGDVVVRVNRRSQPRLRREGELAATLPPEVRYPAVVAYGVEAGHDWLVLRRAPGAPLLRCWPTLSTDERRRAVHDLTDAMRALHAAPAPSGVDEPYDLPQLLQPGPSATEPLCAALTKAADLPNVDAGAMADAIWWVKKMRAALDPFESTTLAHGDLHFGNVLWDGDEVTALLDLEFSRPAPADLDLDQLLRFCFHPFLFVPVGHESEARVEDYRDVPDWLQEDYPELFAHPRVMDRLRVYSLAFNVRELLENPPGKPAGQLTREHPYRRLLADLRGTGHLDLFSAR